MKLMRLCAVVFCALFLVAAIGCGKKEEAKSTDDKTEKGPNVGDECFKFFEANKGEGGMEGPFITACVADAKQPKSYRMCLTPDGPASYCEKGMKDPTVKATIEAMKATLGKAK